MYEDKDLQRLYDEKYFANRQRAPMWTQRAEFIQRKFKPSTTLDIGCSWGELVKSLNDMGINSNGIDGSDFVISKIDPTIKNKVFKVNLNSDPFPFADNTFDLITGFYVVEHVHNIPFFVKELSRTLKQNGTIWFVTPDIGKEGRNEVDVFTNKFEDWKKIFQSNGFNVIKFSPFEMLSLKGKLGKFKFYKMPTPIQNLVKRVAYYAANKMYMKDTSFILTKK